MRMTVGLFALCIFLWWFGSGCDTDRTPNRVADIPSPAARSEDIPPAEVKVRNTLRFLQSYAQGAIVSMAQSELVVDRSNDLAVQQLAEEVKASNRNLYNQTVQIGRDKGIEIPRQVGDDRYRAVTELENQRSEQFDAAYLEAMERYHRSFIEELEGVVVTEDLEPLIAEMQRVAAVNLTAVQELQRERLLRTNPAPTN